MGLGVLACAIALGSACNKKGTPPGTGNTGESGTGTVTMNGGSGNSGTAGSGSPTSGSAGTSTGSAGKSGAGTSGGSGTSGGTAGKGTAGTSATAGTNGGGSGSAAIGTCPGAPGCPMCAGDAANKKTGSCEGASNGVYAFKVTVDVWWDKISIVNVIDLVDAGRGKIVIYLKGNLSGVCEDGTGGMGVMQACGTELPPFTNASILCEAYALSFPDALWDSPMAPTFKTGGTTTGFNPGDTLMIQEAVGLLGIDLMDPMGTWPTAAGDTKCTAGMGSACYPDHDGDSHPGVTALVRADNAEVPGAPACPNGNKMQYHGTPLDAINPLADPSSARGTKLYLGIRTGLSGGGKIDDNCRTGHGDSTATSVDNRVVGCEASDGSQCVLGDVNSGAGFVDSNSPVYTVLKKGAAPPSQVTDTSASMGPLGEVVRLGDPNASFSCADVRAAFK
jgi:hypothetical protein